jgi:hypothetical protein
MEPSSAITVQLYFQVYTITKQLIMDSKYHCFKPMSFPLVKNVIIALKRIFLLAKLCEVLVSCHLLLQPKQNWL